MQVETESPTTHLDRGQNPLFGGFQGSNIVEATIIKVHTDEANNVTLTADVVTIKNEAKYRVPFLCPYANASGTAGIFAIPNVGDKCLVALAAGNTPYIIGYHPTVQLEAGRSSAAIASSAPGPALKGTFVKSQLIPGAIELKSPRGNRIMIHPGGSIAIDADVDLFTFYDAVSSTIESLSRNINLFTAGGVVFWNEGDEKAQKSMEFFANMFTKSATEENIAKGPLRGGAQLQILFSEDANHFFLEITDEDGITSRIQIGPNGIILTSANGTTQGSIAISPTGNFSFIAGDPDGVHTVVEMSSSVAAISAFVGTTLRASAQVATTGQAVVTASGKVTIDAPVVVTQGGKTFLGALGGLPAARVLDPVVVFGVMGGPGSATGFIRQGSSSVFSA